MLYDLMLQKHCKTNNVILFYVDEEISIQIRFLLFVFVNVFIFREESIRISDFLEQEKISQIKNYLMRRQD